MSIASVWVVLGTVLLCNVQVENIDALMTL